MGASLSSWTQTVLTDRLARNNKKHDSVLKIVTNGKTVISNAHAVHALLGAKESSRRGGSNDTILDRTFNHDQSTVGTLPSSDQKS